jgi:hypothetical protein
VTGALSKIPMPLYTKLNRKWYSTGTLLTSFLGIASVEGNPLELGFAVPQQPISNRERRIE